MFGPLLEAFVLSEVLKQASWAEERVLVYHFRDRRQNEIDFLLEGSDGGLVGIEVKASATVTSSDFRALRLLADAHPQRFRLGVVLYDGANAVSFGERLLAAPFSCLWG